MKRRTVLGTIGATLLGGLAGCLGGGDETSSPDSGGTPTRTPTQGAPFEHPGTLDETFATNGDYPPDDDPADGRPPAFDEPPAAPDADPSSFETLDVNGETVRLAPIDDVYAWYRRGEARFVDARGRDQYLFAHVYGAVWSPAMQGSAGGAIDAWPAEDRIVTYCGCPHHLSSIRAAGLQRGGHTEVYALDEGFLDREGSWKGEDYPMAGTEFRDGAQASVSTWRIRGAVDPAYAGEYVWAQTARQYEAAPVAGDGSYDLTLHFADVTADTPTTVTTPTDSVTRPLGDLATDPSDVT